MLDRAGIPIRQLLGVGVGLPGPVHGPSGQVGSSAILPGWEGLQVAREMEGRLGVPVRVDNDANLGALAELFWGAGAGAADLVYLKVATGIGAGLVFQGRLFHGAGGTAGEIGHLTIDEHGPMCRCGNRGCLETFAAGDALVELLRSSLGHELTAEEIVDQAIEGDVACRRAIADAGRHLGHAVGAICNLINPSRVVVGGSIGQAGDLLLGEMREAVRRRAVLSAAQDVEIVAGVLGERAEVLGAVALVLGDAETAPVPEAVCRRSQRGGTPDVRERPGGKAPAALAACALIAGWSGRRMWHQRRRRRRGRRQRGRLEERQDRAAAARVQDRSLRVAGPAQLRAEGQGAVRRLRDHLQQRRPGRRQAAAAG